MEVMQGIRTKLVLVSFSHGAVRIPLAQTLNYTPKITERNINEFDNLEVALIVTTYDGADMTFDYLESDSKVVDAMFADISPTSDIVIDDPSNYMPVTLFANVKTLESGKIFASILAKSCKTKGAPYTEPVLEEAKVTRDMSGLNIVKLKGVVLLYSRVLAPSPDAGVYLQTVPPNAYSDGNFNGGNAYTWAQTAVAINGSYVVHALLNGYEVTTGFTATSSGVTLDDAPADTDVWEFFTAYQDV